MAPSVSAAAHWAFPELGVDPLSISLPATAAIDPTQTYGSPPGKAVIGSRERRCDVSHSRPIPA